MDCRLLRGQLELLMKRAIHMNQYMLVKVLLNTRDAISATSSPLEVKCSFEKAIIHFYNASPECSHNYASLPAAETPTKSILSRYPCK